MQIVVSELGLYQAFLGYHYFYYIVFKSNSIICFLPMKFILYFFQSKTILSWAYDYLTSSDIFLTHLCIQV